jgi:hypothetical protein
LTGTSSFTGWGGFGLGSAGGPFQQLVDGLGADAHCFSLHQQAAPFEGREGTGLRCLPVQFAEVRQFSFQIFVRQTGKAACRAKNLSVSFDNGSSEGSHSSTNSLISFTKPSVE